MKLLTLHGTLTFGHRRDPGTTSSSEISVPSQPVQSLSPWAQNWKVGKDRWYYLGRAQWCLFESDMATNAAMTAHWYRHNIGQQPLSELYHLDPRELLCRYLDFQTAISTRFFSTVYSFGQDSQSSLFEFATYINVTLGLVIHKKRTFLGSSRPGVSTFPIIAWSDLVFRTWAEQCHQEQKSLSSLRYLYFSLERVLGDLDVTKRTEVLQSIVMNDLKIKMQADGSTTTRRYDPGDNNFYALLGTNQGAAVVDMLTYHIKSLATRDEQSGAITKVKTVRSIRFAGYAHPRGDVLLDGEKTMFQMLITLDDIAPPVT